MFAERKADMKIEMDEDLRDLIEQVKAGVIRM